MRASEFEREESLAVFVSRGTDRLSEGSKKGAENDFITDE